MMPLPLIFWRCLLFVPGSRPDRFAKALASGADAVCVDLEDAVPPSEKLQAREIALRWLAEPGSGQSVARVVRCNAVSSQEGIDDVRALVAAGCRPDVLMVPKVNDAAELRIIHDLWPQSAPPLLAIVESPAGVLNAATIAAQAGAGLLLGAVDLAAALGVGPASPALAFAKGQVVFAAKAAHVQVLDTPALSVADTAELSAEARSARAWGFTGKAAIHPRQVPDIQTAFTPTEDELATAQRALAAFAAGGERAMLFEGRLLEKPIVEGYRRTLFLAARTAQG
mgnify:CR=1 FL=1